MKNKIVLLAVLLVVMNVQSQTKTFIADINDERNLVKFESEAPLEKIIGLTNRIGVTVSINPKDITKNASGITVVDVGSFKTGITMRDNDMKSESFLNTEKYPMAEFLLTGFSNSSSTELKEGSKITATANGKLTIHGITKDVSVPVDLTYFTESKETKSRIRGNLLIVNSSFTIKMTDYNLRIPALLFYKLQDEIKISISFVSTDAEKIVSSLPSIDRKTSSSKKENGLIK